jgi:hypothetical protein
LLGVGSCTRNPRDESVEALPSKIQIGARQREVGDRRWLIQSDWNVLVTLDESKKVKAVVVKKISTGP